MEATSGRTAARSDQMDQVATKSAETGAETPAKWLRCNGQHLRKLTYAGLVWLDRNHQHVNALNVFPVPDGDTGTNMLLTMRSAYKRVEDSDDSHVGRMAGQIAQGALMGARGNSGVILSQIWRGLAQSVKEKESFDAPELAQALRAAVETAYSGVMQPVEGTILTVIREGAEEAADAALKSNDLRFVLERVLERSRQALERTPDQLPILKQSGVVDSGGQGLVYILEGMLRYTGQEPSLAAPAARQTPAQQRPAQALAAPESGQLEFPYDVQFILQGAKLDVNEVRRRIDEMGDSTVVVGDEATIKVHIHVRDPGVPLTYGAGLGTLSDVVVENMQLQMEEIVQRPAAESGPAADCAPDEIAVVAVAAGKGFSDIFHSLGAAAVVNGGQTHNPSTEELFQAVENLACERVILLPNNKNILLAAKAASELSAKEVAVVPTRSIPEGISAMLALDAQGDLASVEKAMTRAIDDVVTGEITRATRSVTIDGVVVKESDLIALVNGHLRCSGPELAPVVSQMLEGMDLEEREIVTIYYGADVSLEQAEELAQQIEEEYPDLETEILAGGQAHYFFVLGAE